MIPVIIHSENTGTLASLKLGTFEKTFFECECFFPSQSRELVTLTTAEDL